MHHALFTLVGLDTRALPDGPTTPDLEWPTWLVYSAVPLGSTLMCFRFLQVLVNVLRTDELPHHDHSHVTVWMSIYRRRTGRIEIRLQVLKEEDHSDDHKEDKQ